MTLRRDERGFTLVELLIVVVTLGILAGLVVFATGALTKKAQDNGCAEERHQLETAVEGYLATHPGVTRASLATFGTLVASGDIKRDPVPRFSLVAGAVESANECSGF